MLVAIHHTISALRPSLAQPKTVIDSCTSHAMRLGWRCSMGPVERGTGNGRPPIDVAAPLRLLCTAAAIY